MYQLLVYYADDTAPRQRISVGKASEVLALIPELLAAHAGCERVVVMVGDTRLFSVDCHGNRQP